MGAARVLSQSLGMVRGVVAEVARGRRGARSESPGPAAVNGGDPPDPTAKRVGLPAGLAALARRSSDDSAGRSARTLRRQRRGRAEDPFDVAARALLAVGWFPGLLVGGSLGWAAWDGQVGPLRSSLALLATAATVVIVLGSDAFGRGGERGFGTPARRIFAGTALWVMALGVIGVVFAAAALPWLGPDRPWFMSGPVEAMSVGAVGFVFGVVLSAPLTLAVRGVLARSRQDAHPEEESPDRPRATGAKARAGEFAAGPDDPFGADTLGRRGQVERFCERVQATSTPVVWTVEGAWGTGKTAFARMSAAVMRAAPDVADVIEVNALTQGVTGTPMVDLAVAMGRGLEGTDRRGGAAAPAEPARRVDRGGVGAASTFRPPTGPDTAGGGGVRPLVPPTPRPGRSPGASPPRHGVPQWPPASPPHRRPGAAPDDASASPRTLDGPPGDVRRSCLSASGDAATTAPSPGPTPDGPAPA